MDEIHEKTSKMHRYTQTLYQIVWSTKYREKVLLKKNRHRLFSYMWGILKKKGCHPYQINGVEDHIHIVTDIHPTVALSFLVKDLKVWSSAFIKKEKLFPNFRYWQEGYGAFTYSIEAKRNLIRYVKNQERHHARQTYREEFLGLLEEHEVEFDERMLL